MTAVIKYYIIGLFFQVIQEIQKQFDSVKLSVEDLPARRAWRDKRLAALAKLKRDLESEDVE